MFPFLDHYQINGSLARRAIKDLMARGSIRLVSAHASQQIYTRSTNTWTWRVSNIPVFCVRGTSVSYYVLVATFCSFCACMSTDFLFMIKIRTAPLVTLSSSSFCRVCLFSHKRRISLSPPLPFVGIILMSLAWYLLSPYTNLNIIYVFIFCDLGFCVHLNI